MQVTWNVSQLDRRTSDGFVTTAHWQVTAADGEHLASTYSMCSWNEGEPKIAYENLIKEQVLAWVWESVDKTAVEANLNDQIEAMKNPIIATGVPW